MVFQSTPSLRKVTSINSSKKIVLTISIHTFLAEGDLHQYLMPAISCISIHTFLAEGDDGAEKTTPLLGTISIHTFLAEGD